MTSSSDPADRSRTPECVWPVAAELGEGPVWSAAQQALYFVDVLGRRVHRYTPSGAARASWMAPARPTFIVPIERHAGHQGGLLCGLEDGLREFDAATGLFGPLQPIEPELDGNRINDGHVDAAGRLWFGTMHDGEQAPTGSLYRLDRPGAVPRPMDAGYTVSNGPAIDPARGRLYHSDSALQRIYAFDLDAAGGLGERRVFARLEHGYPDGMAVDQAGTLWVALFAGGGIRQFRPDGSIIGTVELPCDNVTKIAFGGDDGCTAYVTTATKDLAPETLARQPLAGGLFSFRVEVPGVTQNLLHHAFAHRP